MSRGLGSSSQDRPCPGPKPGPWDPGWPEEVEGADTVPLGKRIISGLYGKGVGVEPARRHTTVRARPRHFLPNLMGWRGKRGGAPVDEGRSSHTRFVRGVRLLQSPSEWTEDTEDGLSPPDRPGPGDLALRPLERPPPFEDFPPPANKPRHITLRENTPGLCSEPAPAVSGSWTIAGSAVKQSLLYTDRNPSRSSLTKNQKAVLSGHSGVMKPGLLLRLGSQPLLTSW